MCQALTMLRAYMNSHLILISVLGGSTIIVPVLYMGKLRCRDVDATCSVTQLISSRYNPRSVLVKVSAHG